MLQLCQKLVLKCISSHFLEQIFVHFFSTNAFWPNCNNFKNWLFQTKIEYMRIWGLDPVARTKCLHNGRKSNCLACKCGLSSREASGSKVEGTHAQERGGKTKSSGDTMGKREKKSAISWRKCINSSCGYDSIFFKLFFGVNQSGTNESLFIHSLSVYFSYVC